MPTRLMLLALALPLAACGSATLSSSFNPRARILVMPSDVSQVLQIQLDNVIYQGNARPGELKGQVVTVTSLTGASVACTFGTGNWNRYGPGYCRDAGGRQFDMLIGEDPKR